MTKNEIEGLEREMKAHGWTSEINFNENGGKVTKWALTDPEGEPLRSAWPPFVGGFAYGFLRGWKDRDRQISNWRTAAA